MKTEDTRNMRRCVLN